VLPRRSTNRTDPDAASRIGVAPNVRSGNSHDVGAAADRNTIDSFNPNVVADSSRSAFGRRPRYTAASPCATTGTAAALATPNPSDTPSPRSSRARSAAPAAVANDAGDIDRVGSNRPSAGSRRNDRSSGLNPPDASGTNVTFSNNRRVRLPSGLTNSVEYGVRAATSSTDSPSRKPSTPAAGRPSGSVGDGCQSPGAGVPSFTVAGTGSAGTFPFAPCDCSAVAGGSGSVGQVDCAGGEAVAPGGITGPAAAGTDTSREPTTTSAVSGATHRHRRVNRPITYPRRPTSIKRRA
jgi:hypothetical protein